MELTRRTLVKSAVAGSVLLAGCGDGGPTVTETGDDGGGIGGTDTETEQRSPDAGGDETPEETATDGGTDGETGTEAGAATVQVAAHPDYGEILVGPDGLTLYMFEEDSQGAGQSACTDDCTGNWPPLTVEAGDPEASEDVMADLSTFERANGDTQVAANGWPLYYFANDEEPGDATGQGANEVWWVLDAAGNPVESGQGTGTGTSTPTGDDTSTSTETDTA